MREKYSVLMSVYIRENPEYFSQSVESMLIQTETPNEIIIVKDGPLTDELEKVVDNLSNNKIIKFVELEKNIGLGKALQIGLSHCNNELVARMDSDDISHKTRCEKQLDYFEKQPDLSIVGTSVSEFTDNPDNIVSYQKNPTNYQEIKKYIKTRNPFNHMSVMFKKSDILKAGNYMYWHFCEDYYLWLRMFLNGNKFANIDESLVNVRVSEDTFQRRGGWKYFIAHKNLFDFMLKHKIINGLEYAYNNFIGFVFRVIVTNKMRKWLYLKLLRS